MQAGWGRQGQELLGGWESSRAAMASQLGWERCQPHSCSCQDSGSVCGRRARARPPLPLPTACPHRPMSLGQLGPRVPPAMPQPLLATPKQGHPRGTVLPAPHCPLGQNVLSLVHVPARPAPACCPLPRVPVRPALVSCPLPRVPALWRVQLMPSTDAAQEPGTPVRNWDREMRGQGGQGEGEDRGDRRMGGSPPRCRGCISAHRNKVGSTQSCRRRESRDTMWEDGKRWPGPCSAPHSPEPPAALACATTKHQSLGRAWSFKGAFPGDVLLPCHSGWLSLRSPLWRGQSPWSCFWAHCCERGQRQWHSQLPGVTGAGDSPPAGCVGAGQGCGHWRSLHRQDTGKVTAPAALGPPPSLGYSPDLPPLGYPRWERVEEAMEVQQGSPQRRGTMSLSSGTMLPGHLAG